MEVDNAGEGGNGEGEGQGVTLNFLEAAKRGAGHGESETHPPAASGVESSKHEKAPE